MAPRDGARRHNRGGRTKHPDNTERWGYGNGNAPFKLVASDDGVGSVVYRHIESGREYTSRQFREMLYPAVF